MARTIGTFDFKKIERRHTSIRDRLAQNFISKHKLSPRISGENGVKSPEQVKMLKTLSHQFDAFVKQKEFNSRALSKFEEKLLNLPQVRENRVLSQNSMRQSPVLSKKVTERGVIGTAALPNRNRKLSPLQKRALKNNLVEEEDIKQAPLTSRGTTFSSKIPFDPKRYADIRMKVGMKQIPNEFGS